MRVGSREDAAGEGGGEEAAPSRAPASPGLHEAAHTLPFVGREDEMRLLRSRIAESSEGRGRIILVTGEPGIGRSRFLLEAARDAEASGVRLFAAAAAAGATPLSLWTQAFEGGIATATAAASPPLGASDLDAAQRRFRTFEGVSRFLEQASRNAPLALLFDDVERADPASLELLRRLAREIGRMRVLIVASASERGWTRREPWTSTCAEVLRQRFAERLALARLDEAAAARLVEKAAGFAPAPEALGALDTRGAGNPLFLAALVRGLVEEGRLSRDTAALDPAVPDRVRALVHRRLAELSADTRAILSVASVIGTRVSTQTLRRVVQSQAATAAGAPGGGDSTDQALAAALDCGAIVEVDSPPSSFRFSHELVRETLYEDLAPGTRAALHTRAGEVLAEGADADGVLSEVVRHFRNGFGDAAAEKAMAHAVRAAERAAARMAHGEAASWYREAIAAIAHLPADHRRLATLWLSLGEALVDSGARASAREAFAHAADASRKAGDAETLAGAALGYAGRWMEVGVCDDAVRSLLEEALHSLGAAESGLRARVLARLAAELAYSDVPECAPALGAAALSTARRAGDVAALAYAFAATHLTTLALSPPRERLGVSEDLMRMAEAALDARSAAEVSGWRVDCGLEAGDIALVDREIERHKRLSAKLGDPAHAWLDAMFAAMRALHDGWIDRAETLATDALAVGERAQDPNAIQAYTAQLFFLRSEQSRLGELRPLLAELVRQYPLTAAWRVGLAFACAKGGDLDAARAALGEVARDGCAAVPRDRAFLTTMMLLAETTSDVGDAAQAATLYDLMLPYAGRNVAVTGGAVSCGAVERYLGLLATARGRRDLAERHLAAALEMHRAMRSPPLVAHTQCDLAALLLAGDPPDRERAARLIEEAAAVRGSGMTRLVERVETLRGKLGDTSEPAARPGPAARAAGPHLFRKEGDFWTVRYRGDLLRLRHSKGLDYLARLLRNAGRDFLVLDLVSGVAGDPDPPARALRAESGRASATLDARARGAYKRRLDELRAELEDAERHDDRGRADRVRAEIDHIADQLRNAIGFGSRGRSASPALERARSAVSKRIASEIKRIRAADPALGRHLATSIRTGYFCSYRPDAADTVEWTF